MAPWFRLAVVGLAAFLSAATQPAVRGRTFPMWRVVSEPRRSYACADLETWVAKSGKEGAGIVLAFRAHAGESCAIRLSGAALFVGDQRIDVAQRPAAPIVLLAGGSGSVYLPFAFDNERAWNAGARDGRLWLALASDGFSDEEWTLHVVDDKTGTRVER